MNTFEMTLYGWSGELSIHTIPEDMYSDLMNTYGGTDAQSKKLYDLCDWDAKSKWDIGMHEVGDDFYWHDGDLYHNTSPTNHVHCVQVNGKDIDITNMSIDLFPERNERMFQNGYIIDAEGLESFYIPTIGFCAYEKGCQGSYTIETTDRDFDINKVSVDIIHTSHSSFIEDYYYDGKLMEQTGDMEGETKNMEVNWGCLPKHMIV
jgi:hypothetical protein